ncbi:hypothetical protein BJ684DRAFT_20416 [Piptocephalis cylindrospora]|uniref:Uncharacterized protein n=1 Tax=Piptocephalis cylindrospora TaxID=1907219 RepID=A0A4P9Y2L8_9FUNG|nr:hypothetical protein BJ684DRAFT_20416 [Piptocephalis cylindrospora]|eukprot:RKP13075.1 hypothetical protein BJ684DRAFT_20416 [Piptocephalis cylindrospora]
MTFSDRFCNSKHMKRLQSIFCKNREDGGGGAESSPASEADSSPPPAPAPAPAPVSAPAPSPASAFAPSRQAAPADEADEEFTPPSPPPSTSSSRRQTSFSADQSSSGEEDIGGGGRNTNSGGSGMNDVDDDTGSEGAHQSPSSSPTGVIGAGTSFPGGESTPTTRSAVSGVPLPSSSSTSPFPARTSGLSDSANQTGSTGLLAGIAACATIAVVLLLGLVFLVVRRRRRQSQAPSEDSDILEKGGGGVHGRREYKSLATGDDAQEDHSSAPPALYDRPSPAPSMSTPPTSGSDLLSQMTVPVSPTAARTSLEHAPEIRASPPPVTVTGPSEGPVDEDIFGASIFHRGAGDASRSGEILGPHGSIAPNKPFADQGTQPVGTFESSVGVLGDVEDFPEVPSIDPADPRLDHQR